ncbi:hypothetical protein ACS3HL_003169 [Providencia stuartii]|nr:hypothetical protein [Providencia stuartii]
MIAPIGQGVAILWRQVNECKQKKPQDLKKIPKSVMIITKRKAFVDE